MYWDENISGGSNNTNAMAHITSVCLPLLIFLTVAYFLLTTFYKDERLNRRPEPQKNGQIWSINSSRLSSSNSTEGAVAATDNPRSVLTTTQPIRKKFEKKKILFYTSFFELSNWGFGMGHNIFQEKGCLISDCIITNNRNMLGDISGVVLINKFLG